MSKDNLDLGDGMRYAYETPILRSEIIGYTAIDYCGEKVHISENPDDIYQKTLSRYLFDPDAEDEYRREHLCFHVYRSKVDTLYDYFMCSLSIGLDQVIAWIPCHNTSTEKVHYIIDKLLGVALDNPKWTTANIDGAISEVFPYAEVLEYGELPEDVYGVVQAGINKEKEKQAKLKAAAIISINTETDQVREKVRKPRHTKEQKRARQEQRLRESGN